MTKQPTDATPITAAMLRRIACENVKNGSGFALINREDWTQFADALSLAMQVAAPTPNGEGLAFDFEAGARKLYEEYEPCPPERAAEVFTSDEPIHRGTAKEMREWFRAAVEAAQAAALEAVRAGDGR